MQLASLIESAVDSVVGVLTARKSDVGAVAILPQQSIEEDTEDEDGEYHKDELSDVDADGDGDGNGKEETNESEHANTQVPNAQAHNRWPEWEHDTGEHNSHHGDATDVCRPLRAFIEPRVVLCRLEHLLWVDLERPW